MFCLQQMGRRFPAESADKRRLFLPAANFMKKISRRPACQREGPCKAGRDAKKMSLPSVKRTVTRNDGFAQSAVAAMSGNLVI
jgi:hypothetical protein